MRSALSILALALAAALLALACARPQTEISGDAGEEPDPFELDSTFFEERHPFFRLSFFNFDDIFRRISDQLKDLTANVPDLGPGANATSTHQVIDGHEVTVNETTYKGNNSFVHVKVVQIQPSEARDTENVETAPSKPDSEDNEIEDFSSHGINPEAEQLEPHEFHRGESEIDNSLYVSDTHPINLERDTYVNKIIEEKTRGGMYMVPSNVEVFDIQNGRPVQNYSPFNHKTFRGRTQLITV